MEIKEEKIIDPIKEADDALRDAKPEEYTSSGESTMTCSTLSSLVSLPALESLSDSAPDLQQPDAKSNQSSKRNRRGKRGRKPKQLPKTSPSDDDLLKEIEAMEKKTDCEKRVKILLPQKVSKDLMTLDVNVESSLSEKRFVDNVNETISALPNFNTIKVKNKKGVKGKYAKKHEMNSADTSENRTEENDSDPIEFDDTHKDQLMNEDFDSGLSGKESPNENSDEAEIAFEKKVSELCKDIQKTTLGNRKIISTIPSSSKATSTDIRLSYNLTDGSSSAGESNLLNIAGPSTSHGMPVIKSDQRPPMRGKIALAEKKKKIFKKRKDSIMPKVFDETMKRKIMKLTDEIDQIDAILAKEIDKKDDYYKRGYKVTHQILENLKKEKEG